MTLIDVEEQRQSNPVDVIEQIAALNDWAFERAGDDEISISIEGGWAEYQVSFSWLEEREAIHLACAFDLKVPEARKLEVMRLLSSVNEQLWIGIHSGLLILAAVGICVGFVASVMYLVQAYRLKAKMLPGEGLRLWADLQRRGVEAKFLYFPDENHWVLKPQHSRLWYETVLAWLDHHVLGKDWAPPELL